ncbi:hypothetical protein FRB99_004812, partial [Tulasnella sp. 403]
MALTTNLCQSCTEGYRLPGEPKGQVVTLGFQQAYRTVTEGGHKAIVLLTDAFGMTIPNGQLVADTISERLNITVFVPDMFN